MIRQIKYGNKFYIFPADNDPPEWAYQIFRYLNPDIPQVPAIPKKHMVVALNEITAQKQAEQIQRRYTVNYPEDPIKIAKPQELIVSKGQEDLPNYL